MPLEVKGLAQLQSQLLALGGAELAGKALARAARKAFQPVLDAAKRGVPRDTGRLADSLMLKVIRPKSGDEVIVVGIKIGKGTGTKQANVAAAAFGEGQTKSITPARRWHFIELGTSKRRAHPFLRPALDSNAGVVLDTLKAELRELIRRGLRRKSR